MSRGSFLSRGNQVLSRLAQMTTDSDGPIKQPKNNRNFLFTTVSPTKDQEESKPIVVKNYFIISLYVQSFALQLIIIIDKVYIAQLCTEP